MTEKDELIFAYKSYMHNKIYATAIRCAEEVYKISEADGRFLHKDFRDKMVYELSLGAAGVGASALSLSRRSYFDTAPDWLDDFMIAMEWD